MPSSLEVVIEQALIAAVPRAALLRVALVQRVERRRVRRQHHQPAVEAVWPSLVRRRREGRLEAEQLRDGPEEERVGVEVDDLAELYEPPEVQLGRRVAQVLSPCAGSV